VFIRGHPWLTLDRRISPMTPISRQGLLALLLRRLTTG